VDRELLSGEAPASAADATAGGASAADELEPEDEGADTMAIVTSDGWMFLPFDGGVELLAVSSPEATADALMARGARGRVVGMLSSGDLAAARVVRGSPDPGPWRVEALGRDRNLLTWSFETEDAARSACELLERLVVRIPTGPDGEPEPLTAGDFEEARRVQEQTEQELAMMPDSEEPEDPA
jgi:hypothetical protein